MRKSGWGRHVQRRRGVIGGDGGRFRGIIRGIGVEIDGEEIGLLLLVVVVVLLLLLVVVLLLLWWWMCDMGVGPGGLGVGVGRGGGTRRGVFGV